VLAIYVGCGQRSLLATLINQWPSFFSSTSMADECDDSFVHLARRCSVDIIM